MEIFQSIWTALTTPNEFLTNILSIPLAFLDAFVCMILFTTILNITTTRKQRLLYVLIFGTFTSLTNLIISNSFIILLLSVILWPVLVILIFKTSILKGILAEIIPYILSLCLELFITKLLCNQTCQSEMRQHRLYGDGSFYVSYMNYNRTYVCVCQSEIFSKTISVH